MPFAMSFATCTVSSAIPTATTAMRLLKPAVHLLCMPYNFFWVPSDNTLQNHPYLLQADQHDGIAQVMRRQVTCFEVSAQLINEIL